MLINFQYFCARNRTNTYKIGIQYINSFIIDKKNFHLNCLMSTFSLKYIPLFQLFNNSKLVDNSILLEREASPQPSPREREQDARTKINCNSQDFQYSFSIFNNEQVRTCWLRTIDAFEKNIRSAQRLFFDS
jgi:hypothetical protein